MKPTYEELEAKCAALAAENALLKKSEPAPFSKLMMEALDVYQAGADEVPELAMLSAYKKLRDGLKTPATDAFLAEVRAQGVDLVCDYHKSRCEALRDVDRNGSQRHGAALCDAIDIAYQIRKGVQS
ncbi:hypothetical protein ABKV66_01410 [Enterobacter hormaechei]